MKKQVFILLGALFLSACADKNNYHQAVLEEMKNEQDVKDYKIAPEKIADCVVDLSSNEMPGLFPFDPARLTAYRNYAQMLQLHKSKDPKKTMMELRSAFGSAKALADAHTNYTESIMECLSVVLMDAEKK
jgi:hypothetical protein